MIRLRTFAAAAAVLLAAAAHAGPDSALSERLFEDGNGAFLAGDLARATAAYQALVEEGIASPELETNLGTALLRADKRGAAALHYERALFLDPGDDDAKADLVELRRSNVDRLEGESDERSGDELFHLFAPLPGTAAAFCLIGFWAIACGLFAIRALSPQLRSFRQLATAAWIALALAVVCGAVSAASAAAHKIALQRAVMVAPSTPAREGPQEHAASSFEVHEGTLVRVEDQQSGFSRVRLQNGLVGWVPSDSVERIVTPRWGGVR